MADQTIDAIKVRLGLNVEDVKSGVQKANTELANLGKGGAKPHVNVEVRPALAAGSTAYQRTITDLKKGFEVPVTIKVKDTGNFSVKNIKKTIVDSLNADGGVNVPIKVSLNAAQASALRKSITDQVGIVPIYFDWVAKNGPPRPPDNMAGPGGGGGPSTGGGNGPRPTPGTGGPGTAKEAPAEKQARQRSESAQRQASAARTRQHQQDTQQAQQEAQALGGAGSRPRAARTAAGAPAGGTATGGYASTVSGTGDATLGLNELRSGKNKKGRYRAPSAPTAQANYPYAPGTNAALMSSLQRTGEGHAQGQRHARMRQSLNPAVVEALQQFDSGGLAGFGSELEDILQSNDPAEKQAMIQSLRVRAGGHGGIDPATGQIHPADKGRKKLLRKMYNRMPADTELDDLSLVVQSILGTAARDVSSGVSGGTTANLTGALNGGRMSMSGAKDPFANSKEVAYEGPSLQLPENAMSEEAKQALLRKPVARRGAGGGGHPRTLSDYERMRAKATASGTAFRPIDLVTGGAYSAVTDRRRAEEEARRAAEVAAFRQRRAEGGVMRTGLPYSQNVSATMVGERGPEMIVSDGNRSEVIPSHQISHRAAGGQMRNALGQFARASVGGVVPVSVQNWPPGLMSTGGAGGAAYGAPVGASGFVGNINQAAAAAGGGAVAAAGAGRQQRFAPGASNRRLQAALEVSDIRSQISEAQSLTPVRALSVSVGQIFSQLSGRAAIQQRAHQAGVLADQANKAIAVETKTRQDLSDQLRRSRFLARNQNQLTQKEQTELQALPDTIARTRKYLDTVAGRRERAVGGAREAAGNIISPGAAAKNILASAAGITVGTLAFSAAFNLANDAIAVGADVLGKWFERASGFQSTAAKVTSTLADQTRTLNGNAEAALAASNAQDGMAGSAAATLGPLIKQRVETEAGNKAIQDQLDTLHTYQALVRQQQPGGYDRGLTQGTGGFLGTPLFAVPSTIEQLTNELPGLSTMSGRQATARARGVPQSQYVTPEQNQLRSGSLTYFNAQLEKGGTNLRILNGVLETQYDIIRNTGIPGADKFADSLKAGQTHIEGLSTDVDTARKQVMDLLQSYNIGATTPDVDSLLKQLNRQIPAQLRATRREGVFERERQNPADTAFQYAIRPLTPYGAPGTGQIPNANPLGGAAPGFNQSVDAYKDAYKKYADVALPAQKAINAEIAKGQQELMNLVPDDLRADFKVTLDQITSIGKAIQGIQFGINQQQLNLQVAQYNNELRIARRSLSDAKDLYAGINGSVKDTLGGLEGQNIAISRQLQLLGFELQQRQINYKLALAGFVAPGSTPEERQARIDEAKIEASYAQKQLDLQKQLAANQYKGTKIEAGRSIQDLEAQINLLTQGRALTIDTAAAQAAIEALQGQQDILVKKAQSYLKEGQKNAALIMQTITDLEVASGEALSKFQVKLVDAFQAAGKGFANAVIGTYNAIERATSEYAAHAPGAERPKNIGPGNAAGVVGYTAGTTSLTVGEAGTEHVAVLRNPRSLPMSALGGGGGTVNIGGINITISGGGGSDLSDANRLADQLARKVEERLSRKLQLLGSRSTFGTL